MKSNPRLVMTLTCAVLAIGTAYGCTKATPRGDGLTGGNLVFSDDFNRDSPGDKWENKSGRWEVRDGWAHIHGDQNEGLWLRTALPDRARVEFDAKSMTPDGDLKCEIFARARQHQSGYIVILGGWKNTISIIARLNEHGTDRIESPVVAEIGRVHHFTVIRNGDTLKWYLDGKPVLSFKDADPIDGVYFAFNNWASDAWYDNLRVYDLSGI